MKRYIPGIAVLLVAAWPSAAQGPRGQQRNQSNHPVAALDMTRLQTVSGAVTSVDASYGAQYPSLSIGEVRIKIAPVWFFLDNGFEIKAGDQGSVIAAPSRLANDPYLYAVEINNITTKSAITLRDSAGIPLWTGTRAGAGAFGPATGAKSGVGCIDPGVVSSVEGTVDQVSMGVGVQMPVLVVRTAAGGLVSMKIGPERVLLAADFELRQGESVSATYLHLTCTDENVALQLTNAAGQTVILRNDDGTPAWN